MSTQRKLVQSAVLSGGSIFVSMLATLIVGKLITNALPPPVVGILMLLLLWSDFFNIASTFGVTVSMPKLVASAPEADRTPMVRGVLGTQTLLLLLLAACIWAFCAALPLQAMLISTPMQAVFMEYLWLLPLLAVAGTLRDTLMAMLAGLNRYAGRSGGIIVASIAQVLLIGALCFTGHDSLETVALATAASYAFAAVWLFLALPAPRLPSASWRHYRDAARFGWPLHLNSLLTFLYQRFDTVLVTALLGVPAAAVYEMAKRVPSVISRVLGALLVPFLPSISEFIAADRRDRAEYLLNRTLVLTTALGYLLTLGIVLCQEPLILLLFNRDYLSAAPALGFLLTATCLAVQAGIMGQTLIALHKPKWVTLVNVAVALLSLLLNFALLPLFGILGAAWAALASMVLSTAAQAAIVHRHGLHLPLRSYLLLHGLMAGALGGMLLAPDTAAVRAVALVLYAVAVPALAIVPWAEGRSLLHALLPSQWRKRG